MRIRGKREIEELDAICDETSDEALRNFLRAVRGSKHYQAPEGWDSKKRRDIYDRSLESIRKVLKHARKDHA